VLDQTRVLAAVERHKTKNVNKWKSKLGDLAKPKLNRWSQFIEYNTGTKPPKGRRELKYKFTKNVSS